MATLRLEIVTPETTAYSEDVEMVTLPGSEGELGVYPKHVPVLTILKPGELRVVKDKRATSLAVGEGFIEITPERVSVLTDMALEAQVIDEAAAEKAVARAQAAMKEDHTAEEVAAIQASLQKALAQLHVKRRRHSEIHFRAKLQAPDQLAIIAGIGVYPRVLARAARAEGVRMILALAFEGETEAELGQLVDEICWLRVGQLNRMLCTLRDAKITSAMMAGQIAPRNLFDLHPDWRALLLLAKLKQRNAESIFRAIAGELEKIGVALLPATTFLEDFLAGKDLIVGPKLSRREKSDIELGWDIAQKIEALDIGQTIIVKNGAVLAIEGFDGTNETMRRGGALGCGGAVMIKVAKPNQDMRFDVPVIGRETISVAAEAKIRVIALEASRTLLLEKQDVIRAAQNAKISLFGR